MTEPQDDYHWLRLEAVLALHEKSLLRFGGSRGLRDRGLLESALARPQNLLLYGEGVGLVRLATAYMVGIIRNHPFVDGNKRAGLAASGAFLHRNGMDLRCDPTELFSLVVAIAAGEADEDTVATWLETKLVPREP